MLIVGSNSIVFDTEAEAKASDTHEGIFVWAADTKRHLIKVNGAWKYVRNFAAGTTIRTASAASGTQDVALDFKPKRIIFSGVQNSNANVLCDGLCEDSLQNVTYSNAIVLLSVLVSTNAKEHNKCIKVVSPLGAGHEATVTLTDSGFTYNWTKLGAGLAISVIYYAEF